MAWSRPRHHRLAGAVGLVLALSLPFPAAANQVAAENDIQLTFPMDPWVVVTDSFGAPRDGHRHEGNDIMAPKMSPVYAVADGVVSRIATQHNAGRYLVVTHAEGWESWYVHLNNDTPGTDDGDAGWEHTLAEGIEEGVEVTAGQLLGWMGDSGNAEGSVPHLHFELHYRGRPVDPYHYLMDALDVALRRMILAMFPLVQPV